MAAAQRIGQIHQLTNPVFDREHGPGEIAPLSGIYECLGCGDEIAANKGDPLPPQNRHQHKNYMVPIRWRLVVFAVQK